MKMGWALLGSILFFSMLKLKAMERVAEALLPTGQSTAEESAWGGSGGEAGVTHTTADFSIGQCTEADAQEVDGLLVGGGYIDEWLERWRVLHAHVEEPWPLHPAERLQWEADGRVHTYAATAGSFDELLQFLEVPGYPVDIGRTPHEPETALHAAARAGLFDHCVLLLIAGADPRRYDAAGCKPAQVCPSSVEGEKIKGLLEQVEAQIIAFGEPSLSGIKLAGKALAVCAPDVARDMHAQLTVARRRIRPAAYPS